MEQQQLAEILKKLQEQSCQENLLEELEKILQGFLEEDIPLPQLFLSFERKGFQRGDKFVSYDNIKDIDFVVDPSAMKLIIDFMEERKYKRERSNHRNPTFNVREIKIEFMVKSEEELKFETNLWHLFLFKMFRRMTNPALKGLRISGTKILFEFENLLFRLSDNFSSLISKLGFTSHVFSSVVEMAAAFLKSPVLKDEITDELLFKLVKSLFREGSHRHFFAFLQQLMLQNNSKYQLRTDDGKTWSLCERNESSDFTVLHTLREMDNKQVEPPLGPEVDPIDPLPRYSYETLLELSSKTNLLQKLMEKQESLPCEVLGFHATPETYTTLLEKIRKNLNDFSYEKFISQFSSEPISMKKFFRNPAPIKKHVQLRATEMKIRPDVIEDSFRPFDRLSQEELEKKVAEKRKQCEISLQSQLSSDFEEIVRSFQQKADELSTKEFNMVCERISKHDFYTRINQSKESFDTLVENIKQSCSEISSLPEIKEERLIIFNQVRQILDTRPEYANINASTKKRMIDEALELETSQGQ